MDRLIPVMNKLQDVLSTVGSDMIDLPQIVVIGSQSSGKSSVLEAIVGRTFLPRGSGIVTRRPLVLQLIQEREGPEYGVFLHKPDKKYVDFDEILHEIEAETDRVTGSNKGISPIPISLKVHSPEVVNLTLVDLPGITKVPVGDQPSDIEKQIRDMVLHFIEKPSSLILAVTSANTDLANSDALQLAKLVDPSGNRTLGVITKIDLMDRGTNALDVLSNEVVKLRLGFIGVVNRSQQDINDRKPISEARKAEAEYFTGHPSYRAIAARCGTPYLSKTLNKLLLNHIKACLPELRQRITNQIPPLTRELATLGNPITESFRGSMILEIITTFCQDFKASIDGSLPSLSSKELLGGARIAYIFHTLFYDAIEQIDPCAGLTEEQIRTVIRNATGTRAALFTPEASLEVLVKKAVARLKEPSQQCVNLVYDELVRILNAYEGNKDLQRFTVLHEKLHAAVTATCTSCLKPTYNMVNNLINVELAYINTRHPDFARDLLFTNEDDAERAYELVEQQKAQAAAAAAKGKGKAAAPGAPPAAPAPAPAPSKVGSGGIFGFFGAKRGGGKSAAEEKDKREAELIRSLLQSYFAIVKKRIQDGVPKTIMHFLVNNAVSHLQNELVKALYQQDLFSELTEESDEIQQRRQYVKTQLDVLKKAQSILAVIRDYRPSQKLPAGLTDIGADDSTPDLSDARAAAPSEADMDESYPS